MGVVKWLVELSDAQNVKKIMCSEEGIKNEFTERVSKGLSP